MGPAQIDSAGTLSGYIQHRSQDGQTARYALTCGHVVDPDNTLGPKPYVYDSGRPKVQVTCPAARDHQLTMKELKTEISILKTRLAFSNDAEIARKVARLDQTLMDAVQYNTDLGHVFATSGLDRALPQFTSCSDWALISITNPTISPINAVCNPSLKTLHFDGIR